MDYFHRELVNTMLHCGVDKIASLGREHVERVGSVAVTHTIAATGWISKMNAEKKLAESGRSKQA